MTEVPDEYDNYPHDKYAQQLRVGHFDRAEGELGESPIFISAVKGSAYIVLEKDPSDGEALVTFRLSVSEALWAAEYLIHHAKHLLDAENLDLIDLIDVDTDEAEFEDDETDEDERTDHHGL